MFYEYILLVCGLPIFFIYLMNRSFKFWSSLIHHLFHLWLLLSVLPLRKSAYSHVSYFLSKSFIVFYIYGCHELIFVCGVRWRFIFFVWIFVCSSTICWKDFLFLMNCFGASTHRIHISLFMGSLFSSIDSYVHPHIFIYVYMPAPCCLKTSFIVVLEVR